MNEIFIPQIEVVSDTASNTALKSGVDSTAVRASDEVASGRGATDVAALGARFISSVESLSKQYLAGKSSLALATPTRVIAGSGGEFGVDRITEQIKVYEMCLSVQQTSNDISFVTSIVGSAKQGFDTLYKQAG
jgi:hypothetical protein